MSLFGSVLTVLGGGGTSINFRSGFLNLLHKRYQPIDNPSTLIPQTNM